MAIAHGVPLESARPIGAEETPRAGTILVVWMALTVLLQLASWLSGARATELGQAVEFGAARVESRGIGEVDDEVVRKAIGIQHDTTWFWTVLALIGDFGVEPLGLAVRAGLVATFFGGIALLKGRSVSFAQGLAGCAWAQGFWVLGLAVRVALEIVLRRPEVETSATLLLPAGTHAGTLWLGLRQLDVFAMMGWFAMGKGGWTRGQVGLLGAILVCGSVFALEAGTRLAFSVLVESGMRLSLMPEV